MAKTRFWGRVVSRKVEARSFRRPCRGEGGSVNEGPAASACVGGELGGGPREASSRANVESPQAPAVSVGECAGGTTPPPDPRPQGSVPLRCTLAARGGEEGECGKELVGAPRGRDGCGSPLGTECGGGGGLWIKRPSIACGPQHLVLCTPERIEVWGALAAETSDTRHPARARQPMGTCPIVAPSFLLSWLLRFSLGLSSRSLPLSPLTLQHCHLFAWPPWPLSLPHFRMSLRHLFGSLFREVPKTLEVGRNLGGGGLRAGSGPQGISWALRQRTTGMTWLPAARGCPSQGVSPFQTSLGLCNLSRPRWAFGRRTFIFQTSS